MAKDPRPDGPVDPSLGERAAIARIEEALFGEGPGPVRLGRYEVLDALGSGAFGRVYRARDPELDRTIAITVLTDASAAGDPRARARLLREARTMATVAHPNVATVFDAGVVSETDDARVFLAMELVDGESLREWLGSAPRSRTAIVDALRQAGRGLAAAHAAGVVHRDLKPDNVLVGRDGRVRVVDFGLSRPADDAGERPSLPADGAVDPDDAASGVRPLRSATGALLGTPAYMAPEQFEGRAADARSDQFAYCVTLWEALCGARPFAGGSLPELAAAVCAGGPPVFPRGARVPSWLRRLLLRGLSVGPEARFASMPELLSVLDRGAPTWPRIALAVAAAGALVGVGALLTSSAEQASPCTETGDPLAGVWDQGRRAAVAASFSRAVPGPRAADVFARTRAVLDRYGQAWAAGRVDACEATNVRHEQTPDLLDRRVGCLVDRRRQLAARVDVRAAAVASVVEHAVQAAHELPPVRGCADIAALVAGAAAIRDEQARRAADALYDELARAHALHVAGRSGEALAIAASVRPRAVAIGYAPLEAVAALWMAETLTATGRQPEAMAAARDAFDRALAGSDERVAVQAAGILAFAGAFDPSQKQEALRWVQTGRSLLQHLPGEDELVAKIANAEGNIYLTAGEPAASRAALERAIAAFARLDPDHPNIGSSLAMLGVADLDSGALDSAEQRLTEALGRIERTLGAEHPEVASSLVNLSLAQRARGRYVAAEGSVRRALALQVRTLGADHPLMAYAHLALAEVLAVRGLDAPAAAEFGEAERIALMTVGPQHPLTAQILASHADALARRGQSAEARARAEQSVQILAAALGPTSPAVATPETALAAALLAGGAGADALVQAQRALGLAVEGFGEQSPQAALARRQIGEALASAGQAEPAAAELAKAEAALLAAMPDPRLLSEVRFARARAMAPQDRAAALALATQALAGWPAEADPTAATRMRQWLATAR